MHSVITQVAVDVPNYNKAATEVIKAKGGIATHDLYAFALPRLRDIQLDKNVHFHEEGSNILAGSVANAVRQHLRVIS